MENSECDTLYETVMDVMFTRNGHKYDNFDF